MKADFAQNLMNFVCKNTYMQRWRHWVAIREIVRYLINQGADNYDDVEISVFNQAESKVSPLNRVVRFHTAPESFSKLEF